MHEDSSMPTNKPGHQGIARARQLSSSSRAERYERSPASVPWLRKCGSLSCSIPDHQISTFTPQTYQCGVTQTEIVERVFVNLTRTPNRRITSAEKFACQSNSSAVVFQNVSDKALLSLLQARSAGRLLAKTSVTFTVHCTSLHILHRVRYGTHRLNQWATGEGCP